MSLDRLISAANDYKRKVPHVASKSLKLVLDDGEPVEVGNVTVENDPDGCVLVVTTARTTEGEQPQAVKPEEQADPEPAHRGRRRPGMRSPDHAVPQQDRPEVREAEGGPVEEA